MFKKESLTESQKILNGAANAVAKCGDVKDFYENAKNKNATNYQSLVEVDRKMQLLTLLRDENNNPENFHGALTEPESGKVLLYVCSTLGRGDEESSDPQRETYYFNSAHECVQEGPGPNWWKGLTGKFCEPVDAEKAQEMNMLMTVIEKDCDKNKDLIMGGNLDLSLGE